MNIEAPNNGIYIVLGEINLLLTNLKKTSKYSSSHYDHSHEPLSKNFFELKTLLNDHSDLSEIDPSTFLAPFLEVIKSEETSGPVTGLALTSVNKFISYGLIGINSETSATCVQQIADSITHARFVGTDSSSDEVVLMKILHVLRTLMLSPIGFYLTNSSVCEIMQSCFQICFENRLTELLRRTAESMLVDMVQLLFARLPQFKEEIRYSAVKKLTMKGDGSRKKKSKKQRPFTETIQQTETSQPADSDNKSVRSENLSSVDNIQIISEAPSNSVQESANHLDITITPNTEASDESKKEDTATSSDKASSLNVTENIIRKKTLSESSSCSSVKANEINIPAGDDNVSIKDEPSTITELNSATENESNDLNSISNAANAGASTLTDQEATEDYVNPRGVRFVQDGPNGVNAANVPYGLPCVRELLRFLISLINSKNSDVMISMGLNLITIGLESGIDHISLYQSLLAYVRDDLCKNLFNLLSSERLAIYSSSLRVSFLLLESLRGHLKLQLEYFLIKLMEIIVSESNRISQEQKEMTIDYLLQMLRIPGFAIEIYLNYDCSLNCTNLFEDLTKLLSKNAFSVQSLLTANSLSLSALLTIVENIELENTVKQNISSDRLSFLQNSLTSIRAPPSSGFSAATQISKITTLPASVSTPNISDDGISQKSINRKIISNNMYKPMNSNRSMLRVNRMKVSQENLPTQEQLKCIRTKKRLMSQSVDLFNSNPSKCIQFLKDNSIFSSDPKTFNQQLIKYLKETPALDKKVIGDYLSTRKNISILEEFIYSFNFSNLRIDEALRLFLETFRLPGEAPLISTIMEIFAKHWRNSNNGKFANDDAAFTLAYAIIMLNVDQHNHNVKKQSIPMVVEEFKKNLSKVNGGGNFDEDLLEEIYLAIKNEEIVMPAEHTGAVRDNYLWKVLIRRGQTSDANFIHAPAGSYNQEIFNIVWGQTISALSFVYDKSLELSVIQKSINGFKKCAQVAAHYMMSDVFDNIVISLCKFTLLSSQSDSIDQLAVNFGINNKAQLACKTVFHLVHNHGDILRDGWKNILDCIIQLYKAKLLPKVLIECEDYLHPKGRIVLIKEVPAIQKPEGSGLFSSFFPFMSSELSSSKGPTLEEQEATKNAQSCVEECHIEQLIHDTKFLRLDSLVELIKALIFASQLNDIDMNSSAMVNSNSSIGTRDSVSSSSGINSSSGNNNSLNNSLSNTDQKNDSDAAVFSLEILVKVVLQNRDRISSIWSIIRNHFYNIIINSSDYSFFLERTIVGLLRISARLLRREELANEVLGSLRMLLVFKKKSIIRKLSRQVSYGIHDLLRTNAANIHSNDDWSNIFTILQVYGAGANAPDILIANKHDLDSGALSRSFSFTAKPNSPSRISSDKTLSSENLAIGSESLSDRGYTSDSELYQQQLQQQQQLQNNSNSNVSVGGAQSDQNINTNKREFMEESFRRGSISTNLANQYKIDLDDEGLGQHDKKAFAKCCETLTFLIRDMAHITLQNFESCIHCLRTFVEACVLGDRTSDIKKDLKKTASTSSVPSKNRLLKQKQSQMDSSNSNIHKRSNSPKSDESDEDDQFITSYETISIQLLDLLDTLHIKAASIFTAWAEEQRRISQQTAFIDSVVSNLWSKCWCPILQGIARLSCDTNGEVRMHALQYLQRALLVHELQTLSAMEWEACFNKVLFPLLAKLLENIDPRNALRMEETRMRASTLLCKVFLQHLTTLARLSTFTALWLTILDYMDKYMKSDRSDLLHDVIPESLKNMLLVMETTGLFNQNNPDIKFSQLCVITKDRIESFLPGLWEDLFRANNTNTVPAPSSPTNKSPTVDTQPQAVIQQPKPELEEPPKQIEEPKQEEATHHQSSPVVSADTSINQEESGLNETIKTENDNNTNILLSSTSEADLNLNAIKVVKSSTEIKDI